MHPTSSCQCDAQLPIPTRGLSLYQLHTAALKWFMHAGVLRQPEVAHRLDAETGGLVLCGKTTAGIQGTFF